VSTPFSLPSWLEPRTAYVHVPFCGHHCGYCDFAVTAGQDHLIELYLDAVEAELRTLGDPRPVESLFIGGGTPTYLSPDQLARLLAAVNRWLPLVGRPEFSIESTPESLDPDKVAVLAAHGVNRISIGVQSFRPHLLRALDRRHGVEHIPRAVEAVRRHIPSLSFDLIFAAPGQTLAEWDADLADALQYEPDHLSTYGLTYEKGTPLWKAARAGAVTPAAEDAELEMYLHAIDRLGAAGFEHYEISNFARSGRRSVHNQRYWANEAYYGFGVGAARYVHGRRELNVRNTKDYVRRVLAGESPTFQAEGLGPRDRAFETVATQLRRADGIDRVRFREQTGFRLDDLLGGRLAGLVAEGLLRDDGASVRLTRRGQCVADGVIAELMTADAPTVRPSQRGSG
jgi:oxygen-independent coproporphyrinogen-3 oxidase